MFVQSNGLSLALLSTPGLDGSDRRAGEESVG